MLVLVTKSPKLTIKRTKKFAQTTCSKIISGNWTCDEGKFTCGNGHPRCISQTRTCNELSDCSDGSDETAALCGECHIISNVNLGCNTGTI